MSHAAHAQLCALLLAGLPSICVSQTVEKPVGADELPAPGAFPAGSANASNYAWPRGKQPAPLDSWPKNSSTLNLLGCWKVTPLQDTATGWPGQCLGLASIADAKDPQMCRDACRSNSMCSVWQFVDDTGCWHGSGTDSGTNCFSRDSSEASVVAAQRLQHGSINVMLPMKDVEIVGLTELGVFASAVNTSEGIARCRNWCYSNIFCQYWQYGARGCWVDAAGLSTPSAVQYPLTTSGALSYNVSEFARVVWDGEYVQHFCPAKEVSTFDSLVPESMRGNLLWVAGGVIALIVAVMAAVLCRHVCRGGRQKSRAVTMKKSRLDAEEDGNLANQVAMHGMNPALSQQLQPLNGMAAPSVHHPGYQMTPSHTLPAGYAHGGYGGGYGTGHPHAFQYS